jgi:class 3 adenylate cyclase
MTAGGHELAAVLIREPGRVPLRLLLSGSALEVGRDCRGLLLADPQISRRHLSLQQGSGTVRVTDLGSSNGTRVDGTPINGTHELAPGEVVQLGTTTIVLLATAPNGTPTIVFCDIEDSTRRAVELGDVRWVAVLELHDSIVRRHVDRHGGSEIEAHGDGLLLSFLSPQSALWCMVDVQRALSAVARSRPTESVRMRVGAHASPVTRDDHGDGVRRDAEISTRVAEAARGGEILVSGGVRELVEPSGDFAFGPARLVTLQELGADQLAYPIEWDDLGRVNP